MMRHALVIISTLLLCAAGISSAQTNAPPPIPRYFPTPDSPEGMAIQAEMDGLSYSAKLWSKGVTNNVQLKTRDLPAPERRAKDAGGHFTKKPEPTKPYYRMKVWNDLTQDYIEFRAYVPGNTGFFQGELVTE